MIYVFLNNFPNWLFKIKMVLPTIKCFIPAILGGVPYPHLQTMIKINSMFYL